ncbi:hypothetical protein JTE90_007294 [Oedothorax gibbosus]|uniref:Uncharacterized protein n=1 Tax=Oedothorax gibbosus TaxID=931172 RepID=A0AAV6VNS6_9ARAC|nr:hypothetical protein JTE90_007294 [Oedothorax gibbosus]
MDIVRHLLETGADPNVKLSDGLTPLYLAVGRDDMEIADCLLKSGADCNEDIGYETPFERYVAREDDYEFDDLDVFIENGAYITSETYSILMKNMMYFQKEILEDVVVCKQLILNKFNNLDLPKIYQVPFAVKYLPAIKGMKIAAKRYAAQCIEESVIRDIDTKGFCNITEIQPIVLSLLSAKAFIKYFIDYKHYHYIK